VLDLLRSCSGSTCWFTGSPVPPSCTLTADKNIITSGTAVKLDWSSSNAEAVVDQDGRDVAANGSASVAPAQTTTYSYRFTNSVGSVTCRQMISVSATGLTASGLPVEERNAAARALGYTGKFGDGQFAAWLSLGSRSSVWSVLTLRILANPGTSVQEIYMLFPNLEPTHYLGCGTKSVRDSIANGLGFTGMFGVTDSDGVRITDGEFDVWRNADPARQSAFDAACHPSPTVFVTPSAAQTQFDGTTIDSFTVN
jgi:hypothetical protein